MSFSPYAHAYLITIPAFAADGIDSVVPRKTESGSLEVIMPKGTVVDGVDVSLYRLLLEKKELDPFPSDLMLPLVHCFYLEADALYTLFQVVYQRNPDGSTNQRRKELRFQARELSRALGKACQMQGITVSKASRKQAMSTGQQLHELLLSLEARAVIARKVSESITRRR